MTKLRLNENSLTALHGGLLNNYGVCIPMLSAYHLLGTYFYILPEL